MSMSLPSLKASRTSTPKIENHVIVFGKQLSNISQEEKDSTSILTPNQALTSRRPRCLINTGVDRFIFFSSGINSFLYGINQFLKTSSVQDDFGDKSVQFKTNQQTMCVIDTPLVI